MNLDKLIEINYKIEQAEKAICEVIYSLIDTETYYINKDEIKNKRTFFNYAIESERAKDELRKMNDDLKKLEINIRNVYENGLKHNCKFSELKTATDIY